MYQCQYSSLVIWFKSVILHFNPIRSFGFHYLPFLILKTMQTFVINLLILYLTMFTLVEVRPISKLEESLIRYRRQNQANTVAYQQNSTINNEAILGDIWNHIQPVLVDHLDSHLSGSSKPGCKRTINDKYVTTEGDYVEYCLEKLLNENGQSYSTKTRATLYKSDGRIIPLHEAESNIEIETYNHLN
jgi:hypothetical protein